MVNIDAVKFGELEIDGKIYYSDMTVWWDGKIEFRKKSHVFDMPEFKKVLKRKPDSIVIGTGLAGIVKVPDDVREIAKIKKIKIFVDTSSKAIDIFNGLAKIGKKAVAIIHTTC
ncbi:MAG: hypothetical protein KAU24_02075 [Candidatus Aenigmarchaeota archaeon]|nr:hypothetical protein [Candidatus Aenigmarchaeota archaeon]